MKHYNVILSDKAALDMDDLYKYISEDLASPETAADQYDRIADAILTLEEMPGRVKIMDSEPACSRGLRNLIVNNYSALFIIKGDEVIIARVLYSASDISARLSEELL